MIFQKGLGILLRRALNWHNFVRTMRETENPLQKWVHAMQAVRSGLAKSGQLWRAIRREIFLRGTPCYQWKLISPIAEKVRFMLAINKNLANSTSDRLFDNSRFTDDGVLSGEFNFECFVDILGLSEFSRSQRCVIHTVDVL